MFQRRNWFLCGLTRTLGWNEGLLERGRRKEGDGAGAMDSKVVSLQINTAGIMAMNRVDRIVLDPIRTYACTRTARTGVRVTMLAFIVLLGMMQTLRNTENFDWFESNMPDPVKSLHSLCIPFQYVF